MRAAWYRFRADLSTRVRSVLALAFIAGIVGGATLTAVAGARRTDSAYRRMLADTNAWQVLVNPDRGSQSALRSQEIAALPQVDEAARLNGMFMLSGKARTPEELFGLGTVFVSDGRAGYSIGRPKLLRGRMPHRDNPLEVSVNQFFARLHHVSVGSSVPVIALTEKDLNQIDQVQGSRELEQLAEDPTFGHRLSLRVTGIGVLPDDIVVDEGFSDPQMLLTPAFTERYALPSTFWGEIVRLRHGRADIPAFRTAVEALVPSEAIAFETTTNTEAKVARAVEPQVGALTVFAIVLGLCGLLVMGQALARQTFLDTRDHALLSALGLTRAQLFTITMLRAAIVAVGAAAIALIVAFLASPLTPIGAARVAEPAEGFAFDALALGVGAVAVALSVLVLAVVPAWRQAGVRAKLAKDGESLSRTTQALAASGAPPTVVAGVRMALDPGRGATAVPARTTLLSAAVAIATVVAALVMAASLNHLTNTPRLYGWNWDVLIDVQNQSPKQTAASRVRIMSVLRDSNAVKSFSTISLSALRLPRGSVTAVGVQGKASLQPTVVDGRIPRSDDEVALGSRTLTSLHMSIGDDVVARANNGKPRQLHIVGRVVLPGLGTYQGSDKSALGEGAVITRHALHDLGPNFHKDSILVDFRRSASQSARNRVLHKAQAVSGATQAVGDFQALRVQRPSDIRSYEQVRSTPVALAALLALLAAATVAHALIASVRRRRRDFALFTTLGFTSRQVSSTIAWQATTVAVVALLGGIPLGIALGRIGWKTLAGNLGTVSEPIVPALILLAAIPLVLALLNAVAFIPGRIAARLRPASVLRSE